MSPSCQECGLPAAITLSKTAYAGRVAELVYPVNQGFFAMTVYKQPKSYHFAPDAPVEKHFHDYDETWVVTKGRCLAFMVDQDGRREEFVLEAGDIWMVEAGVEHGFDSLGDKGVDIFPFPGSLPEGCHDPGHYYMEKEGYIPRLTVEKTPTDRYEKDTSHA